jgi:hypothetical protein
MRVLTAVALFLLAWGACRVKRYPAGEAALNTANEWLSSLSLGDTLRASMFSEGIEPAELSRRLLLADQSQLKAFSQGILHAEVITLSPESVQVIVRDREDQFDARRLAITVAKRGAEWRVVGATRLANVR